MKFVEDAGFAIPFACPTTCSLCGHFAATREERKHLCPVAAAINGANVAIGLGVITLAVMAGLFFGHLCGVYQ